MKTLLLLTNFESLPKTVHKILEKLLFILAIQGIIYVLSFMSFFSFSHPLKYCICELLTFTENRPERDLSMT